MKNTEKLEKSTISNDEVNPKEQVQEDIVAIFNKHTKEKDDEGLNKVLNNIESENNNVNVQKISIMDNIFQKVTKMKPTIKNKRLVIEMANIILTLLFSLLLLVVSHAQYKVYNRQANISENSNKLAQYQYRFEFYKDLEDLQKNVSIIKKNPQLDIEEYSELNYKIFSLYRESALLFDQNISKDISKVLENHLLFLNELNNVGMSYNDYKEGMEKLNIEYGDLIYSDNFRKYLDINAIK